MTIAEWSLLAAVLIYLFTISPVKVVGHSQFDNAKPRDPQFYQDPLRARALGAHANGIETFPFFAAAVLLAEFRQSSQGWIDAFAVAFVLLRLAFVAAYLANRPTLRSVLWNLAFLANLAIFLSPLFSR